MTDGGSGERTMDGNAVEVENEVEVKK